MAKTNFILVILFFNLVLAQIDLNEGDECTLKSNNKTGVCTYWKNCVNAKNTLKLLKSPQVCGFIGRDTRVCCLSTPSQKYCEKIYPRKPGAKFAYRGKKASPGTYRHMAALGFGDKSNIQWRCGGTLISEKFVLTAAHCVFHREFGIVRWVRLGELDFENKTQDAAPQDFRVVANFTHKSYKPPSQYHDIALLKLKPRVKFNKYIKPACLYGDEHIPEEMIATGWGSKSGQFLNHLMEVTLNHVNYTKCKRRYEYVSKRRLAHGIDDSLQICAGHPDGRDTCQGDSGGPLQFKTEGYPSRYYVVGITSFALSCGFTDDSIGVYTRVSRYLDWIESIVWPVDKNSSIYYNQKHRWK